MVSPEVTRPLYAQPLGDKSFALWTARYAGSHTRTDCGNTRFEMTTFSHVLGAVQMAMIAGLPYTALRDAVLTHPTLVEGLIPLFSSAPTAHNGVETRGTQISAA
jgi:hypothetical protein